MVYVYSLAFKCYALSNGCQSHDNSSHLFGECIWIVLREYSKRFDEDIAENALNAWNAF